MLYFLHYQKVFPVSKMVHFLFTTILLAFLKIGAGVDTLLADQTISNNQTLVSQSHVFEMGFFSPGKSPNRYLGIWYTSTPNIVLWVANRNHPITHSQGVNFTIARNGNLVIRRKGSVIWIWPTHSSRADLDPFLQLLDTGNLVLSTIEGYIWQSFDYPTDTYIPGMKLVDEVDTGVQINLTSWKSSDDPSPGDFVFGINNRGLPEMVVYRGNTKTFRTGKWNGDYFCGVLPFPNYVLDMVFREERLITTAVFFRTQVIYRTTLDNSGLLHSSIMNAKKKWNVAFITPRDSCDEYGLCGPNGICSIDKLTRCECLKGFAPASQKDWDLQDWSGGCRRIVPLDCQSGDGFVEVRGVKYPDMLKFWLNTSMGLGECRAKCSQNCGCVAYANSYITNGGRGCVMWFGDLVDTREVSWADSKQRIYIRLPVSELVNNRSLVLSSNSLEKEEEREWPTELILLSIAFGFLVSASINGSVNLMRRRKRRAAERTTSEDLELPLFEFSTIVAATNNFSVENMIGEGGFGPVYKGHISSEGEVAIKRLSRTSRQGVEEFKNEVILIAKLQHTNLVRLLGCCIEGEERMLIYEYLQNKSLDCFVFDENRNIFLTWPKRFDIIMGIARGLLYLHHDSILKIIHRDLKTSNILLDENLNPKISDFGIARTFGEDQPISRTRRVVGTYGYMAPEYAIAGKYSIKSDIFSMGVVLLEIVSGEKNRGFERSNDHVHSLLGHAWMLWEENKTLELMDECLKDTFMESEVKRCIHVGLLCVQQFPEDRPVMSSVLFMLGNDEAILPEPKEPGFIGRGSTRKGSSTSRIQMSDRNTITITVLEAR